MADALCARERLVAVPAQPLGDQTGWKVGLTNPAAQPRFGTPNSVAGSIYHATLREHSGETFPAGSAPVLPAHSALWMIVSLTPMRLPHPRARLWRREA